MTDNKPTGGIKMTRVVERAVMTAIGSISLLGSATAAELTGAEIRGLISGNSVYLELTASITGAEGSGIIYFDSLGLALYKTPKGVIWQGTWKIEGNAVCTDWKESPHNPCTKYDKRGDKITIVNVATGVARGKVTKIIPGNSEKLTPNY
jgi:hypothetical protein